MIVDFTNVPIGTRDHPAEPRLPTSRSAAASPGVDFEPADPDTTGQVMRFRVVAADGRRPQHAAEPARAAGDRAARRRDQHAPGLAQRAGVGDGAGEHRRERQHRPRLRERRAVRAGRGRPRDAQPGRHRQPARLGRADHGEPGAWAPSRCGRSTTSPPTPTRSTSTRSPSRSSNRQPIGGGAQRPPESWEAGRKDTVIAYPDEITRVKALLRPPRAVRLALPHPRARGQRDDAALPHRAVACRNFDLASSARLHQRWVTAPAGLRDITPLRAKIERPRH